MKFNIFFQGWGGFIMKTSIELFDQTSSDIFFIMILTDFWQTISQWYKWNNISWTHLQPVDGILFFKYEAQECLGLSCSKAN